MRISPYIIEALSELGQVKESEPLMHYTTYRTGGPADAIVFPWNNGCVPKVVRIAAEYGLPLMVIGGGSNLLVGDKGITGIVMRLCEDDSRRADISVLEDGYVYADAIASKQSFLDFAVSAGFGGAEFMAGIPGCLGGGIIMNAGTSEGMFVDILKDVDIVDYAGDERTQVIDKAMTSYRTMNIGSGNIITGARFRLARGYDITDMRRRIDEILADRRKKHPLDFPSAGSVFKNPEGYSSWKLIDEAGLKGTRIGGACVSDLHTNFIINADNATSQDIKNLVDLVRETVYKKFGITLETEVKMIGTF
ncbi:MAG: UDP-N-acetylenolpyruvoylglucosamine reductase [Spirochaetes bacterium RBG_13_51_14]|nr:MAG: UDP-N-acetylenolpyruvoylglucosamine reductase [Spirochaetes bacterium RBG_13_51_14]